jgi:hypothetical protein
MLLRLYKNCKVDVFEENIKKFFVAIIWFGIVFGIAAPTDASGNFELQLIFLCTLETSFRSIHRA